MVRIEDRYDTDIDDLWAAITDPARLDRWHGHVEGDLRAGGEFRRYVEADDIESIGRVEACEPPRRLVVRTRETDESYRKGQGVPPFDAVTEVTLAADGNQTILVMARLVGTDVNGEFYHYVRIELRSAEPKIFPVPGGGPGLCDFVVEPAVGPYHIGQVISFQDTSSMANIIRYEWTFGDGTRGDQPDLPHVYRSAGFFTVTHQVTDNIGATAGCQATIPVQ